MGSLERESERNGEIHTSSATLATAKEQLISAAPPPYTTRLSRTKLRTAQMASCNDRFASSIIYPKIHVYQRACIIAQVLA